MAQIQKGTTYTTGDTVTAANLNALADSAVLLPGAITDQISTGAVSGTDQVLINQSGGLVRATVNQVVANVNLAPYVKVDGTVAMTGALSLPGNPSTALQAAPKQYVDSQDSAVTAAITAGYVAADALKVNKSGDTMTGPLTLAADPAAALQAATKQYIDNLLLGAIMAFPQTTEPTGWLKCNGQAVSRITYAALFSKISTTFGAGDGSTTFNVPDLRGEFLRGLDEGRGVDAGRAIGTAQADAFKSHNHSVSSTVNGFSAGGSFINYFGTGSTSYATSSTGGNETRPRNVATPFFIKH